MDEFEFTEHFLTRATDMAITPEQIREGLLHPDEIVPSLKYDGLNYRKGDLMFAVVHTETKKKVVTVVWSNTEAWERDMEIGEYDGRQKRERYGGPNR
ncbi:hypothetical protein [Nocardia nova]|uniref:hypothetical protein n=1 Tax=Nocardia nova TaxID=37330 RepID=UPI0027383391|nr:hypothetical protein [Nocardia nova]